VPNLIVWREETITRMDEEYCELELI